MIASFALFARSELEILAGLCGLCRLLRARRSISLSRTRELISLRGLHKKLVSIRSQYGAERTDWLRFFNGQPPGGIEPFRFHIAPFISKGTAIIIIPLRGFRPCIELNQKTNQAKRVTLN